MSDFDFKVYEERVAAICTEHAKKHGIDNPVAFAEANGLMQCEQGMPCFEDCPMRLKGEKNEDD